MICFTLYCFKKSLSIYGAIYLLVSIIFPYTPSTTIPVLQVMSAAAH